MRCIGVPIIMALNSPLKLVEQCLSPKGQWLSKTKEERDENRMSKEFALATLIELAIAFLLIYGFMHEEKIVAFEENIKRIVIGNYRRWKRMRGKKKCMKK